MLLSDDGKFAIPTATKTGTFSLESALKGRGFTQRMPRHARDLPDTHHGAQVLFMIRHPYARLVSAYRYGIVKKHSWLLAAGVDGFEQFCRNWAVARIERRPHDWTTLLHEYVDAAQATNGTVSMHRLEDGGVAAFLQRLAPHYPQLVVQDKNINRSADRFEGDWRSLWTRPALDAIGDALAADLYLGDYVKPKAVRHVPSR